MKPRLAIIPGDPSGIGPELVAKFLAEEEVAQAAHILLVGDSHIWHRGAKQAGLDLKLDTISETEVKGFIGVNHVGLETIRPDEVEPARVTKAGGQTSLRCLDKALDFALEGLVDGILFAPFNKAAMTLAGLNAEDEHKYIARYIGWDRYHSEINVLDELMTTRVTSHIPLKEVAQNINRDAVLKAAVLAHETLIKSGVRNPRIGVAALNPHAGDNGKFGTEEISILTPAIELCRQQQINASGPWPSDTVFLKALNKELDAVVTMYHDQGQVAVKLIGFDRGATLAGGLPIPIATPAHGTAFDIVGKNKAGTGAMQQAFRLLVRMANTNRAQGCNDPRL